jgi:membrane-associated protein
MSASLAPLRPGARLAFAGATAAGTFLALGVALGAIETPDVANALSDAADSLGAWTYLFVPTLAFLETGAFVGLAVPGETAIVVGGVVAERGEVSLPALIGLVWAAAVGGDTVSFLLGRRFGRPFLDAHGARLRIPPERVGRIERLFDQHGGKTVLVGRFVGVLRALIPFVAGAAHFPLRRFVPYTAVGALGWVTTFTLVGYGFSESFESAGKDATRIALAGALVIGTVMLALAVRSGRARPPEVAAEAGTGDAPALLLVVNAHASGITDSERTAAEMVARLQELSANADAVITPTEDDFFEALRAAAATGRRAVLVGGDGSLHDAANAPIDRLPELALVPAGRANNVARGLRIPVRRDDALVVAARAPAEPLDALHVQTPLGSVYAIEAVSGGFQAAARDGYTAENSGDLRQGIGLLTRALRNYTPYPMRVRFDDGELITARGAQLFLSNLPLFGFGFCVDPGADSGDGRLEITIMQAAGRPRLLWLLAAAYRGRHVGRPGVQRVSSERADVLVPIPLVADTVALGTTTATVTVAPARLRVAAPSPAVAA